MLEVLEIDPSKTYQRKYDLRAPLGVYNISLNQLARRLAHSCEILLRLMRRHDNPKAFAEDSDEQTLSDYLLLTIYAAAEHVDDLENTLLTFFPERRLFAKSPDVRAFKRALSPVRRRMSGFANALKHQQARIRLFLMGFEHEGRQMCLPGFFVEGVHNDAVGASRLFHDKEKVISLPSFLWEVLVFVYECATLLKAAVGAIRGVQVKPTERWPDLVSNPAKLLSELPNFSFDGPHPFERTTVVLENVRREDAQSPLYGSISNGWSQSVEHRGGGFIGTSEGDGVTRTFDIVAPSKVRLQHWE